MGIEAPRKLQLAGAFMPDDCGGSFGTSHLTLMLEDAESGTTLKLSDHIVGGLREDLAADLTSGWQTLFRDALKPHVEKSTVT